MWSGSILSPVPSMDCAGDLGPDRCLSDPSAPCFYWHTKVRALNGGRDTLTDRELEFVGVSRRRSRSGWQEPATAVPYHEASDPGEQQLGFLA